MNSSNKKTATEIDNSAISSLKKEETVPQDKFQLSESEIRPEENQRPSNSQDVKTSAKTNREARTREIDQAGFCSFTGDIYC
ncbi:hypothetical protein ACS0TY_026320 [Phlomoides rotata]